MRLRSRRFAIVAIAMAMAIGGLWWLSRPNLDPRFVGMWDWKDTSLIVDGKDLGLESTILLRADGTACYVDPAGPMSDQFDWHIASDGTFVLADHLTGFDKLKTHWNRLVNRFTTGFDEGILERHKIREVTADRIKLEYATMLGSYTVMTRVTTNDQ